MLKQYLIRLESTSRWMMGGFALFLAVAFYLVFPAAERLGFAGTGPRAHDPAFAYLSLMAEGDFVVEYPFGNVQDCDRFRSEMLAKGIAVTDCKLGRDLDATK